MVQSVGTSALRGPVFKSEGTLNVDLILFKSSVYLDLYKFSPVLSISSSQRSII